MNCTEARSLFSDYVERSLAPVVRAGVAEHVARCAECARELQSFARTLEAVRRTRREDPPAGLAATIVAALPPAGTPVRRPTPRRPLTPWLAAAAAFLIACALAFAHARADRDLLAARKTFENEVAAALDAARAAQSNEASARQAESAARAAESASREALEALRSESERSRAAFEDRMSRLEAAAAARAAEVDALRKQRSDAEARAARLEGEVAGRETLPVPSQGAARGPVKPAPSPDESSSPSEQPAPHVVLLEAGDRLELQARGTREEVVPELFALADAATEPDAADLAIHALERYLDPTGEKVAALEAPAPRSGLARWWDQRVGGFASASEAGAGRGTDATESPDRKRRLETLRAIWQGPSGSGE